MMGTLHTIPGHAPALRVLNGNLATQAQRDAALALLGDTCPADLLWAAPGTPATRRATAAELASIYPDTGRNFDTQPVRPDGGWQVRFYHAKLFGMIALATAIGVIIGGVVVKALANLAFLMGGLS